MDIDRRREFRGLDQLGVIGGWQVVLQGRLLFLILAISLAHVALLLRITTDHAMVRLVRMLTIGAIAVVAVLLLGIVAAPMSITGAWMVLGLFGMFDVAGSVITTLSYLAVKRSQPAS